VVIVVIPCPNGIYVTDDSMAAAALAGGLLMMHQIGR
jgi:hypothetical protein